MSGALLLAAVLTATAAPKAIRQGGVAEIRVTSDEPLAGLVLVDGDRRIPLERETSGRAFRGILGVDVDAKPGEHEFFFEGDGDARVAVKTRVLRGTFRVQRLSVDPRFVEIPKEEEERVKADAARVKAAYAGAEPARRWSSFRRPLAGAGGNFGARRVYNGRTQSVHAGLDVPAREGTPVAAAANGRIALAGDLYFSGGTVLLDHGGGLFTQYMHLSRVEVKEGDVVNAGEVVGLVGHTGRATGPHLHWGARWNGRRVNPRALLALAPRPASAR